MQASVVICADQVANPAAISGAPCPAGQGLLVVQTEIFSPGANYDSVQASGFFFYGFGVIIFAYLLGYVVQQVRKPIRQGL